MTQMQKKLIALAVASLASGVALAQTNVTMYGIVDVGYAYSSGDAALLGGLKLPGTNKFSGLTPGVTAGNRLGFKGEEDLGSGLKAVFTLEYGLEPNNNSGVGNTLGGLNARQQFVGLASSFGTIAFGRQYAPGFDATDNNDALDASNLSLQSNFSMYAGDIITPNSGARYNNAITYTSNNYSGVTVKAIYGFGESNIGGTYNDHVNSVSDNGRYGLGLNYVNGPINFDAVWQGRQSLSVANSLYPANSIDPKAPGFGSSINEWYLGGAYDFTVVKLFASYQALDNNNKVTFINPGNFSTSPLNNKLWTFGITAPVGVGTAALSYGKITLDRNNNLPNGNSWGVGAQYTYPLSKRTALYAAYTYIENSNNSFAGQTQVSGFGAANGAYGNIGAPGQSSNTVATGIRHTF